MHLNYREEGTGDFVVILHGLYGSSDNWMAHAKDLASSFKVISVDHRNHGYSPKAESHTYDDMVADLAWLFNEIGIDKAHVIGHSMGGKVAMAFAADYPEKINSLTVVDIAPENYKNALESPMQYSFHKELLNILTQVDLCCVKSRKDVEKELSKSLNDERLRKFILKNLKRMKDKTFEWKININVLKKHLDHIIEGVDIHEYTDRLPITGYPVLFIKGSNSDYINNNNKNLIKKMYPDAKIETIRDAGHWLHAEKYDEFMNIVKPFLNVSQ